MRTFKRGRSKGKKCPIGCRKTRKKTKGSRPKKTKMQRKSTKKSSKSKTRSKSKKPLSEWNLLVKETLASMRKKDPNVPLKAALKEASKRRKNK